MTTRLRRPAGPPPPRGRSGRFGLLPPLAMALSKFLLPRGDGFADAACSISVKAPQLGADAHLLPQHAGEGAAGRRALEARAVAARVGTAARLGSTRDERAVAGREAEQLALRSPPAAAGAGPQRLRAYEDSSSADSTSTGIPAGTSASGARCGETVSRSTSPSASATATASGPCVAAASAGASESTSVTSSSGKDGPTLSASGSSVSASASSSG